MARLEGWAAKPKVLAVVRHAGRLVEVEPGNAVYAGFHHALLGQGGDEAAGHDVVRQQRGEERVVENQGSLVLRHVALGTGFPDFHDALVIEILGGKGSNGGRPVVLRRDAGEDVGHDINRELLRSGRHQLFEQGDGRGRGLLGRHVDGLVLVAVQHHRH